MTVTVFSPKLRVKESPVWDHLYASWTEMLDLYAAALGPLLGLCGLASVLLHNWPWRF